MSNGYRKQVNLAVEKLRVQIARAVSRAVCPECGAPLRREGMALACSKEGCEGIEAVRYRIAAMRYFTDKPATSRPWGSGPHLIDPNYSSQKRND